MSIFDENDDYEENTLSLDDLESDENSGDEDADWGDELDDMDAESWDRHYGDSDEELEGDPWDLN